MMEFEKTNALVPSSGRSLHDLVNGDVPEGPESLEYRGLFLHGADPEDEWAEGNIYVQADGHAGIVTWLSSDDYDDVLELVEALNSLLLEWENHIEHGSNEQLVEFAGKKITHDPQEAEENPELYCHVPRADHGEAEA